MKGRKAKGGEVGTRDWEEDEKDRPMRYNESKVEDEAEERRRGGRAKRKAGGIVHHERGKPMAHAKHIGMVKGERTEHHAGRKPRMSGGRACSDTNPMSSAAKGKEPEGHKVEMED
jgi:hypothetical protein